MNTVKPLRRETAEWLTLVLVVMLGCVLGFYAVSSERSFILANENVHLRAQAHVVEANLQRQLESVRSALESLRHARMSNGPSATNFSIQSLRAAMPGVRALMVLDINGKIMRSSEQTRGPQLRDTAFIQSIAGMNDENMVYVSRPYIDAAGHSNIKLSMKLSSPPGDAPGVVTAILESDYFSTIMQPLVYASDINGELAQQGGFSILQVGRRPLPEKRLSVQRTVDSGRIRLDRPLEVTISRGRDVIDQPWRRLAIEFSAVCAAFLLIGGISLWVVQAKRVALDLLSARRTREKAESTERIITALQQHETEIERLAFYDSLTGLPNRRLLLDRTERALQAAEQKLQSGALMFIDLDNFKDLNDTLGHDHGDLLLKQVARRLLEVTRQGDTVARLGGDEFVVMLQGLGDIDEDAVKGAEKVGQAIVERLAMPYLLEDQEVFSTPSVGVAMVYAGTGSVEALLKQADLAMYQAKAAGRNTLRLFTPQMQSVAAEAVELERELRGAIARQELYLHYQPIVDARRRISGVEALARWFHPKRGAVSPAEFIPLAEKSGLILEIGQWVLERACAQLKLWSAQPATEHLTISVNVSARQMRQSDFVSQVTATLGKHAVDPRRLRLELTESMLFSDTEEVIEKMNALRALGVRFSLDDFGTGYSSLSYLKRLPLDQLKIDRSFIREALTNPSDATIATAIVGLAHSLGMVVVAEGVETEAQHRFLQQSSCDAFQGFLYAAPCTAEKIEQLLAPSLWRNA